MNSSEQWTDPTNVGKVSFVPPGSNLHCETSYSLWGDLGEITPLICLRGGPGIPSRYLKPLGLLHERSNIPVLAYDQIGCGDSTHLPEKKGDTGFWTFELFIRELNNLITSLGIQEYDVFGHSRDGMLAAQFALT